MEEQFVEMMKNPDMWVSLLSPPLAFSHVPPPLPPHNQRTWSLLPVEDSSCLPPPFPSHLWALDSLIGTPGRLMHLLVETEFTLKSAEYLVFDEADRLFEMGFAPQISEIMKRMSDHRQTLLFSATMPQVSVVWWVH